MCTGRQIRDNSQHTLKNTAKFVQHDEEPQDENVDEMDDVNVTMFGLGNYLNEKIRSSSKFRCWDLHLFQVNKPS